MLTRRAKACSSFCSQTVSLLLAISSRLLWGYRSLTPLCAGFLKPRKSRLGPSKSTFNAENFICSFFMSISASEVSSSCNSGHAHSFQRSSWWCPVSSLTACWYAVSHRSSCTDLAVPWTVSQWPRTGENRTCTTCTQDIWANAHEMLLSHVKISDSMQSISVS